MIRPVCAYLKQATIAFRGISSMAKYSNADILTTSVEQDNPTPIEANVKGSLPTWLTGVLIRTGPAVFEAGDDHFRNYFDGFALLLRFTIKEGKVHYQSRFLSSDAYTQAFKQNRIVFSEFDTVAYPDPCKNIFHRCMATFTEGEMSDNGNVSIVPIGDTLYASTETHFLRKINADTLQSPEKVDLYEKNKIAVHTQTAHPHTDTDGSVYNLASKFSSWSYYNIVRFDPKQGSEPDVSLLSTIKSSHRNPSYYHSFSMTQNYLVFLEFPLIIDILSVRFMRISGKSFMESMTFDKSKPTYIYILDKKTGRTVIRHTTDAMFCFHHINAYEQDGYIVMDLCHYEDNTIMKVFLLDELRRSSLHNYAGSRPRRFVLPLQVKEGAMPNTNINSLPGTSCRAVLQDNGTVHCYSELLLDQEFDLPQINYKEHNGKQYRYTYGVGSGLSKLLKLDVENGGCECWDEEGCFPAEPIFVATPGATEEDDGVVLSTVLDVRDGRQPYLLILDAKTFKEIARAVVPTENWCYTLHGLFQSNIGQN